MTFLTKTVVRQRKSPPFVQNHIVREKTDREGEENLKKNGAEVDDISQVLPPQGDDVPEELETTEDDTYALKVQKAEGMVSGMREKIQKIDSELNDVKQVNKLRQEFSALSPEMTEIETLLQECEDLKTKGNQEIIIRRNKIRLEGEKLRGLYIEVETKILKIENSVLGEKGGILDARIQINEDIIKLGEEIGDNPEENIEGRKKEVEELKTRIKEVKDKVY